MSIATEMKAIADGVGLKEKENPFFIAGNVLQNVLDQVRADAYRGKHKTTYVYTGSSWRLVHEALVTMLEANGFFANAKDDALVIRWSDPKEVKSVDAASMV
jgi:hypothetical protein